MKKQEALKILEEELQKYRDKSYAELKLLLEIKEKIRYEVVGPSGDTYHIEIQIFWDNKHDHDVRVLGAIDAGGWREIFPLCDAFIMTPEGDFIDK